MAAIVQRELGVMVLTALVVFALLIRAAGTGEPAPGLGRG